jgi:Flp pilus assembly protein TadB
MNKEDSSLLTYAGLGGVVACCLALELLGGTVVLGSIAAAVGLSTGLMYVAVVGLAGVFVVLLGLVYRKHTTRSSV